MSKTESTEKEPRELKAETKRIADFLKGKFSLDAKTGDVEQIGEGSLYEESLPEDLTMKTVKQVHGHDKCFVAAVGKIVGDMSLEAFVENKELQQTELKLPTDGHSSIELRCARQKEYVDRISTNGTGETPPTVHKFANLSIKVKTSLGSEFNIVKRELLQRGKEALAD